ncbi:methyltransferase [Embleya sp. AB8]|uniref:methyltransferase n=1 Tax=Embleya sp. AB8 TaxID=3156304 RepID=UPI003C78F9EF
MTDSTTRVDTRARMLREELARELENDGALRTTPWRDAVLGVARHVLLPAFYVDEPDANGITEYTAISQDTASGEWLRFAYQNRTWVTQLDHGTAAEPGANAIKGSPTSSSTLPATVVRMLEDLDVEDDSNILELGTGTGYSTALLCARLGDQRVTSVEYDADLSAADRRRLAALGYHPTLVVGDGALGHPERAPYQRIIATYSPDSVSADWLAQADDNAVILLALGGTLGAYGYVKLRATAKDRAIGRFTDSDVSFMSSREAARPEVGPLMRAAIGAREKAVRVATDVDPAAFDDPGFLWSAQLALPGTIRLRYVEQDVLGRWFLHRDGSWAVLEEAGDGSRTIREGGPRNLGTSLEATLSEWRSNGRPGLDRYGLTVTPESNIVWLDAPDGATWQL